jgi:hypothetical protein
MHKAAQIVYDTNVTKINEPNCQSPRNQNSQPHPALTALAHSLGRQAGLFFAANRFRGLGALELHRLQLEAKARQELNESVA